MISRELKALCDQVLGYGFKIIFQILFYNRFTFIRSLKDFCHIKNQIIIYFEIISLKYIILYKTYLKELIQFGNQFFKLDCFLIFDLKDFSNIKIITLKI